LGWIGSHKTDPRTTLRSSIDVNAKVTSRADYTQGLHSHRADAGGKGAVAK